LQIIWLFEEKLSYLVNGMTNFQIEGVLNMVMRLGHWQLIVGVIGVTAALFSLFHVHPAIISDNSQPDITPTSTPTPIPTQTPIPTPAPIPTPNSITVTSIPVGASIYLENDKYVGEAPQVLNITQGSHIITLKLSGYEDWSKGIDVEPGTTVSISPRLTPIPSVTVTTTPATVTTTPATVTTTPATVTTTPATVATTPATVTTTPTPSVEIENIGVKYNVWENNLFGMNTLVTFTTHNLKGEDCLLTEYFYFADGTELIGYNKAYTTPDGYLASSNDCTPPDDIYTYKNFPIFFPSQEFNLKPGTYLIELYVVITSKGNLLAKSNGYWITVNA